MTHTCARAGNLLVVILLLSAIGEGAASGTTLAVGGVAQNKSVSLSATLEGGTSLIIKDEGGTTTDTCTVSELTGSTENRATPETTKFTGSTVVGGNLSALTFGACSHTMKTLRSGSLHIDASGNVFSMGAEITVYSTVFGISAFCKTGTGTKIGTFTGTNDTSKHARITIDATNNMNCGILGNSSWTGTFGLTSPTGLAVVD
jgi:hypothetical protein